MPPNTDAAFLISLLIIITFVTSCPTKKDLGPCTCKLKDKNRAYVTCLKLYNEEDMRKAFKPLKGEGHFYSFNIDNSNFNFIPHDAFKGFKIAHMVIWNTNLRALTDTDEAFVGLEDYLETLMMIDCTLMNGWDWAIFKNLKQIKKLDIVGGYLQSIGEELEKFNSTSLEDIAFRDSLISYIDEHAFAPFHNIRMIDLDMNQIKELKRTMFPNPAVYLTELEFSYNNIEQLPDDIFTNMPILKYVFINHNKILVLNGKVFSPVWKQLDVFEAMGNDLRCDCRISWLLEKKLPVHVRAICANPPEVKGRYLYTLTSNDLWCYKK